MKNRGLGRNLDVLLSRTKMAPVQINPTAPSEGELRQIAIDLLDRGRYQPRKDFPEESLRELADSIRAQGIIQPIVVRSTKNNRFEIIAGERRWRAAQLAGLTEVPVLVKEIADDVALAMAIIENIQREDLKPLEEAVGLQRLLDEFAMTHQQVAQAIGKSRTTVTNLLRLLSLQPAVKILLEQNKLEMGHARALLTLDGIAQNEMAQKVITQKLTVRETERLVSEAQSASPKQKSIKKTDSNIKQLQEKISKQLGAFVILKHSAKGKGKMIVHYNNFNELDGLLNKIQLQTN